MSHTPYVVCDRERVEVFDGLVSKPKCTEPVGSRDLGPDDPVSSRARQSECRHVHRARNRQGEASPTRYTIEKRPTIPSIRDGLSHRETPS